MNFSGYWLGPKVLLPRVIMTGNRKVVKELKASRSPAALLAEYGLRGAKGSVSADRPRGIWPYTSSVLTWTNRLMPIARAVSRSTAVPTTSVFTNPSGSRMERSTCVSAARLTIASIRCSRATRSTRDRKSTRLNSSHGYISYAVFCLKKKKNKSPRTDPSTIFRYALAYRVRPALELAQQESCLFQYITEQLFPYPCTASLQPIHLSHT